MAEHWSWLTGGEAGEYTYSPPTRPSRPPHRPLVKLATSAHLHTIARYFMGPFCPRVLYSQAPYPFEESTCLIKKSNLSLQTLHM
ncbi:unnamed protein product [Pieris macdunnoughi]|uniref:Uncharacterized protein n=1 Tax=Pieris macdunnoughi TaxID=345717 RepID=A0A821TJB5_9NEOP|nr:unnamed protein product [Pieris macdunnoughi]